MIAHGLGLITVDPKAAGAKWTCSCGACGFCYPDGWNADRDLAAAALYAVAQDCHRRHVAAAITAEPPTPRADFTFPPRLRTFCPHRWRA